MPDPTEPSGETRRLLILALVVLALLLALHFTPLKAWMDDVQALKQQIRAFGWKGYAGFGMASVAAIALGVPRLALCGLAGVLFGFVGGALVSLASGVAGSYGAFLIARWSGRDWAERKLAGAGKGLKEVLSKPTITSIFIARQVPLPAIVVNVAIGMLPIRHSTFLTGTALGYLPSTGIVALAGSSLGKDSLALAIAQVTLAMAALGALAAGLMWLRRRGADGKE
ncbi:MAG: TVP38/TMEM64 family protein [Hyphomicrobiaceae bacterium]|nr:MAG: TVP38/TMEM64 family protein [Hyphomicrobiaceae bacterium]